jgi:hypothetical protein
MCDNSLERVMCRNINELPIPFVGSIGTVFPMKVYLLELSGPVLGVLETVRPMCRVCRKYLHHVQEFVNYPSHVRTGHL